MRGRFEKHGHVAVRSFCNAFAGFVAEVLFPSDFSNIETNYLDSAAETHAELTEQRSFATNPTFSTKPPLPVDL